MKLAALFKNHPLRLLFFQILMIIATWLILGSLIHRLAPPIPCNQYIEGANCIPRPTTLFLCLDILRHVCILIIVGSSLSRFWFQSKSEGQGMQPFQRLSFAIYCALVLFLVSYVVGSVTALVQAG